MQRNSLDRPGPVTTPGLRNLKHTPNNGGYSRAGSGGSQVRVEKGKVIQWRMNEWSADVHLFSGGIVRHCKITCLPISSSGGMGILPNFANLHPDNGPDGSTDSAVMGGEDIIATCLFADGPGAIPEIIGLKPPESFQYSFDPAVYPDMLFLGLKKGGGFEVDGRGQLVLWLAGANYFFNSAFVTKPAASAYAGKNVDLSYRPPNGGAASNIGMGTGEGSELLLDKLGGISATSVNNQPIIITSAADIHITSLGGTVTIDGVVYDSHVHDVPGAGTSGPPHN